MNLTSKEYEVKIERWMTSQQSLEQSVMQRLSSKEYEINIFSLRFLFLHLWLLNMCEAQNKDTETYNTQLGDRNNKIKVDTTVNVS